MCFIYADLKEIESRIRFGILYELACEHFENGEYLLSQKYLNKADGIIATESMTTRDKDLSTADTLHLRAWLPDDKNSKDDTTAQLNRAKTLYEEYFSDAIGRLALQNVSTLYQAGESNKALTLAKDMIHQTETIMPNSWLNYNLRALVVSLWGKELPRHHRSQLRPTLFKPFIIPIKGKSKNIDIIELKRRI